MLHRTKLRLPRRLTMFLMLLHPVLCDFPTREAAANHYNDRKERFTAASTTDLRHARYAGIASLLTSSSLHFQTTSQTLF